jgi:hypothetical protein
MIVMIMIVALPHGLVMATKIVKNLIILVVTYHAIIMMEVIASENLPAILMMMEF